MSTNYVVNISIMWNKNDKKSVQLPFFRFGCKVGKKQTKKKHFFEYKEKLLYTQRFPVWWTHGWMLGGANLSFLVENIPKNIAAVPKTATSSPPNVELGPQ